MSAPPLIITMRTAHRLHSAQSCVLRIPGGWKVRIARVEAESYIYADYAAYYVATGMDSSRAMLLARRCVQQSYAHGYTNGLREAIWRRAMDYHDMWPQHRRKTGEYRSRYKHRLPVIELIGFDPGALARLYVPMQKSDNRARDYVCGILATMGQRAMETV